MAKHFSKYLGKIALMTAAVLWAGCGDSDKKADETVPQTSVKAEPQQVQEQPKKDIVDSVKEAVRIAKVKSEIGMIRALYGVVEENMGRAVALYGVRPPREIISPDGPREIHQPRSVARCRIKPLSAKNVVVEGRDIDVQTFLKVYRQRVHGLRFICDKNVRRRSDLASEFEGRIVLTLKIASSGEVENVQIKSTTIAENSPFSAINEEVKESVSHWKFPKTKNGATFSFPISFYGELPQPSMFDDSSLVKNK